LGKKKGGEIISYVVIPSGGTVHVDIPEPRGPPRVDVPEPYKPPGGGEILPVRA
jgi:hypothetical protein